MNSSHHVIRNQFEWACGFSSGFASHFPVLLECLNAAKSGPVLELGMGEFSTPLLHTFRRGRRIVSVDSDSAYYAAFKHLACPTHELHCVAYEDFPIKPDLAPEWAVALVDNGPPGRRREDIHRLHGNAEYVVVHDYGEEDRDFYGLYRYSKHYPSLATIVLSDQHDLTELQDWGEVRYTSAPLRCPQGSPGVAGPIGDSRFRPKISLMLHTASPDTFLAHHGIPSAAAMVVADLERQDFRDFELVYVDRWRDGQPALFDQIKPSFPVKHVAVHPAHRYWYDKGYCWISAAKNTGILFADGDLCITVDDGAVFNTTNFLSLYWDYYQRGRYLHAAICHWDDVEVANGLPVYPLRGKQMMDDIGRLYDGHVLEHDHGNWLFTGSSFQQEHALNVNGFSERCDGTKSLEDCDFGIRLQKTGAKFVMDRSVFLHILSHSNAVPCTSWNDGTTKPPVAPYPFPIRNLVAIENYANISFAEELGEYEANKHPITQAHLGIIRRDTLRFRDFDPLVPERAEAMKLWLWTPTFSLRAEREELRRSPTWRW